MSRRYSDSQNLRVACLACFLIYQSCSSALAQNQGSAGSVKFVNGSNESVTLWFQPKGASTYLRPPLSIGPNSSQVSPVNSQHAGKRYVVVRDEGNRDTHIGWIDIAAIAQSKTPVMLVDGLTVMETKMETYSVKVPYSEQRTDSDGRTHTVTVYVTEQRTREVQVTRRSFRLKLAVDGEWKDVPVFESAKE